MNVDKKSLEKVFAKALCQAGKTKLLKSIALRFNKSGVVFMKIEGQARAAFGKFGTSAFKTFKVSKPIEFSVNATHVANLQYLRDSEIKLTSKDNVVTLKAKRDQLDVKSTDEETLDEEFKKFLKMKESEGNKFASLGISDKADQYEESDEKHSPIFAYLIIDTSEITDIPDCDSVVIEGTEDSIKIKSIDFDGGTGNFNRDLEAKFYEPFVDDFSIRIDRTFFALVLKQFPKLVNLTLAKRYTMFLDQNKDGFYGYMVGITGQKQEIISEDFSSEIGELDDLDEIEDDLDSTLDELED